MGNFKDITGMRFGRLSATRATDRRSTDGGVIWECACDCGNTAYVNSYNLRKGITKSCGCYMRDKIIEASSKTNDCIIRDGIGIGIAQNTGTEFLFDKEDFDKVSSFTWTERPDGYFVATINGKLVRMHRYILGVDGSCVIDHKNQKRNDNRKSNLRIANQQLNGINRGCNSNSLSGIKGVRRSANGNGFTARIMKDGKTHHIGTFKTIAEAQNARIAKEVELFGEFAYSKEVV